MTTDRQVTLEVSDGVATVTLNRPDQLNAFTDAMEADLIDALDRCDVDDAVRAVVITGAGRAFCAGMDLGRSGGAAPFEVWRASEDAPAGSRYEVGDALPLRRDGGGRVVLRMYAMNKLLIAAVNGHAVGVGLTMTLAADFRLVSEDAKLGFVFTRRGLVPESCSSWFLTRLVPMQTALDWTLSGRLFTAAEAVSAGLVRSAHAAGQVVTAARELARSLVADSAPVSVAMTRRMMWSMTTVDHPMTAHELETIALNHRGSSADAAEGITAFLEKRAARFPDAVSENLAVLGQWFAEPAYTPPPSPGGEPVPESRETR